MRLQEDDIAWFERGNNVLIVAVVAIAVSWVAASALSEEFAKQTYQQAVEAQNFPLVRCLDTALGFSEKNLCMMKYK